MAEFHDESGSISGTLLTFLLGVAVGATVAILYAPQAGQETRAQIADKAGQIKDKATELKTQVAEKTSQWKDRAAEMMHRAEDTGANFAEAATSEMAKAGDRVRG